MVGGGDTGAAVYDAALKRRQAMMGASGPAALVKNFRVFSIALFACIGGVLYGYNQGMFSGVLSMPAFQDRKFNVPFSRPKRKQGKTTSQIAIAWGIHG